MNKPYIAVNELASLEFETAWLKNVAMTENTLTLTFQEAIIVGHSHSAFHEKAPCSLNEGADRYALPELALTFKNYKILSVLIEENHIRSIDNPHETVIPAYTFTPEETAAFLEKFASTQNSWVYYLGYYQDTPMIYMAFSPSFCLDVQAAHEIWLTAEENIAQWESFGGEAFYLSHSADPS